jgi:hypothetical protein
MAAAQVRARLAEVAAAAGALHAARRNRPG